MTRIEEIEITYFLDHTAWRRNGYACCKLQSEFKPKLTFIGVASNIRDANENCVEVFEIHQHLYRNGLLNHKNLN